MLLEVKRSEKKNEFLYEATVKAGLLYHIEDVPGFSRNCSHCTSPPLNIWGAKVCHYISAVDFLGFSLKFRIPLKS